MQSFWSAKGGVGCSTVALAAALLASNRGGSGPDNGVLLVDLGGDLPAALGLDSPPLGIADWLAEPLVAPDALGRIEVPVSQGLRLLPLGSLGRLAACAIPAPTGTINVAVTPGSNVLGATSQDRHSLLFKLLAAETRLVIVDIGVRRQDPMQVQGELASLRERACAYATSSILVTRLCYLALRRSIEFETPTGIVVVAEPGRTLKAKDVSQAVGASIDATVRWDPAVARAVDAGLCSVGIPRPLRVVSSALPKSYR